MKVTPNYILPQYEGTDFFDRETFNDGFKKIDTALSDLQETVNIANGDTSLTIQEVIDARGGEESLKKRLEVINSKFNDILKYPLLEEELSIITEYGINTSKLKIMFPYCHVNRYGASVNDYSDSSNAIQVAYDICEKLQQTNKGTYKIQFESGIYYIYKTILMKYDTTRCSKNTPIVVSGVEANYEVPSKNYTYLMLMINNHVDKDYANGFAINCKYSDRLLRNNDEDKIVFVEGNSSTTGQYIYPSMNSVQFENLVFATPENSSYNINGIKGYRYRGSVKHIKAERLNRLVWQKPTDVEGKDNVCDFSKYDDISFTSMKTTGLHLTSPDNSTINDIRNHYMPSTAKNVIRIELAGNFKISNFQHAYHFVDSNLVPRNDGVGMGGNTSLIELVNCRSGHIDGLYIERGLKDYIFRLFNSKNIKIENSYEMFFGNGFIRTEGSCNNLILENIYRDGNIVQGYRDINFVDANKNVVINNFIGIDRYSETLTTSYTELQYNSLTTIPTYNRIPRTITHSFSVSKDYMYNLNEMNITISASDSSTLVFKNMNGDQLTNITYTFVDGVINITNTDIFVDSVTPIYSKQSLTLIPYIPLLDTNVRNQVMFLNPSINSIVTANDTKMRFIARIKTINKIKYQYNSQTT